jgi:hypothetical protein
MKKLRVVLFAIVVCVCSALAQTGLPPAAQKAVNAIDAEKIRATIILKRGIITGLTISVWLEWGSRHSA